LARLVEALAKFPDRDIADAIRLLLLTGARRNEVLTLRWKDLNLAKDTWSKPPSYTKQGKHHTVPLSAPACQLLADRMARKADGEYVFPGNGNKQHLVNVWHAFQRLCKTAGIEGLRIHDLRHSYASALASAGHSLPLIGALLGHSQPQTTHRLSGGLPLHQMDCASRRLARSPRGGEANDRATARRCHARLCPRESRTG